MEITDRKTAVEALRKSKELLYKIASNAPGVLFKFYMSPDGRSHFPYVSEAIKEFSQNTADVIYKDEAKAFERIHPDDYIDFMESRRISAENLTPWQHEYRSILEGNNIRTHYWNSLPQRESDDSIVWHGFITDVTERRIAEGEIKTINDAIASQNKEYEALNEELQQTNEKLRQAKEKAEESDHLKNGIFE